MFISPTARVILKQQMSSLRKQPVHLGESDADRGKSTFISEKLAVIQLALRLSALGTPSSPRTAGLGQQQCLYLLPCPEF
jgi:hypothetical protein